MAKRCLVLCLVVGWIVAVPGLAAAYNATGIWDFSEHTFWNSCEEPNPPAESGSFIFMQNGNSATIIKQGRTLTGSVSGSLYTFYDTKFEDGGTTQITILIPLVSPTSAEITVQWEWSDGVDPCAGGNNATIAKQTQISPVYDITGTWEYSESGHWNSCGDPVESPTTDTLTLIQNDNLVSGTSASGTIYTGFLNGSTYTAVSTYPEDGGTTSEVKTINMSSKSAGGGSCQWIWNDIFESCAGGYNETISKVVSTVNVMPAINALLLNE